MNNYGIDYSTLEPGLYVQRGGAIKRLDETGDPLAAAIMGNHYNDPERLAAAVGWVFIALNKRRTQMKELFKYGQWETRQRNEIDAPPFVWNEQADIPRIDWSLQLHSNAYLLKQRQGRRIVGLRFLDPLTVQPDPNSAEAIPGGVRFNRYWRTDPVYHTRIDIDAADMLHFTIPGLREVEASPSVMVATKLAANIIYGMGEMFSTLYQNNALPVMLVEVPAGTSEPDVRALESKFWRLFNKWRGSREHQTIGVREGTKVTKLSIDPEQLDAIPLEDQRIKEILLAHDIPPESVMETANYAVSQDRRRELVGNLGQRINDIGGIINDDPDIIRLGVQYKCDTEQHWAMKRDEADAALAATRYFQMGLTPWAALHLMGITEDAFPEELVQRGIYRDMSGENVANLPGAGDNTGDDINEVEEEGGDEMKAVEMSRFRRWYKKRLGQDVDNFAAKAISKADKLLIADEMLRASWEVYP